MNQQQAYVTVDELVESVSQAMIQDGIASEYINQLSHTWKALDKYLTVHSLDFQ